LAAATRAIDRSADVLRANAVTLSSHSHGDFPAILSELSRNSGDFCTGRHRISLEAFEFPKGLVDPRTSPL
jgi:hypothetical protein